MICWQSEGISMTPNSLSWHSIFLIPMPTNCLLHPFALDLYWAQVCDNRSLAVHKRQTKHAIQHLSIQYHTNLNIELTRTSQVQNTTASKCIFFLVYQISIRMGGWGVGRGSGESQYFFRIGFSVVGNSILKTFILIKLSYWKIEALTAKKKCKHCVTMLVDIKLCVYCSS